MSWLTELAYRNTCEWHYSNGGFKRCQWLELTYWHRNFRIMSLAAGAKRGLGYLFCCPWTFTDLHIGQVFPQFLFFYFAVAIANVTLYLVFPKTGIFLDFLQVVMNSHELFCCFFCYCCCCSKEPPKIPFLRRRLTCNQSIVAFTFPPRSFHQSHSPRV